VHQTFCRRCDIQSCIFPKYVISISFIFDGCLRSNHRIPSIIQIIRLRCHWNEIPCCALTPSYAATCSFLQFMYFPIISDSAEGETNVVFSDVPTGVGKHPSLCLSWLICNGTISQGKRRWSLSKRFTGASFSRFSYQHFLTSTCDASVSSTCRQMPPKTISNILRY
jgi:hypothetical protein